MLFYLFILMFEVTPCTSWNQLWQYNRNGGYSGGYIVWCSTSILEYDGEGIMYKVSFHPDSISDAVQTLQLYNSMEPFHHLTSLHWVWSLECEMWNEYCTFQQMGNKCQIFHSVFLDKISGKNEELFFHHLVDWN